MTGVTEVPGMCRPVAYVVRVIGIANDVRIAQPADVNVTVSPDSSTPATTTLTVILKDQAHLIGVLMELYELGYPILSVEHLPAQAGPQERTGTGESSLPKSPEEVSTDSHGNWGESN